LLRLTRAEDGSTTYLRILGALRQERELSEELELADSAVNNAMVGLGVALQQLLDVIDRIREPHSDNR